MKFCYLSKKKKCWNFVKLSSLKLVLETGCFSCFFVAHGYSQRIINTHLGAVKKIFWLNGDGWYCQFQGVTIVPKWKKNRNRDINVYDCDKSLECLEMTHYRIVYTGSQCTQQDIKITVLKWAN